jgi:hypothetical protein
METKTRTPYGVFLLILAALLLPLLMVRPGYYLYRELEYKYGNPTESEQLVHAYAQMKQIPYGQYPKDLIALLDTSPEARNFVLDYPVREDAEPDLSGYERTTVPLFLQWDPMWGYEKYGSSYLAVTGCGPTCLAMAGYYLTGEETMNPSALAEFAEKNGYYAKGYGSSWTLISEGAEKLGLTAKELPLVKKKMVDALEAGNPVILALGKGDFTTTGHYIVLTGVEEEGFRVNDPNSRENSKKLWTYEQLENQIRNIWEISVGAGY